MAYQQIDPKDLGPHLAKRSEEHLPSAQPKITNEEIRFALKQLGAYFSIKIRDGKEGDVPVELLQRVQEIQRYVDNLLPTEPELKHGKWIERWHENKHVIGDMACSVCGAQMTSTFPKTCPECGAKMDGDK